MKLILGINGSLLAVHFLCVNYLLLLKYLGN